MSNKIIVNQREIKVYADMGKPKAMNHNSKIPESLLPVIHKMRLSGNTLEQLVVFLKEQHDINITISALSKRLTKLTKLNQAVAEAVYTQNAAASADAVVYIVDTALEELVSTHSALLNSGNFSEARMYRETLLKYARTKMDMVSISNKTPAPQEAETSDIDEALSRLDNLFHAATQDQTPAIADAEYEILMTAAAKGDI